MCLIGDRANVRSGAFSPGCCLLGVKSVCVCDEHLPDSEPSEVELTVPGRVSRPATLAEVRLPKMDGQDPEAAVWMALLEDVWEYINGWGGAVI